MLRARIATLLTLLICLVSCEQNKPSSAAPENAKQKISFEKFEDITENHPELYISNPDSFLNSLHLQPQTDEEKQIYFWEQAMGPESQWVIEHKLNMSAPADLPVHSTR